MREKWHIEGVDLEVTGEGVVVEGELVDGGVEEILEDIIGEGLVAECEDRDDMQ